MELSTIIGIVAALVIMLVGIKLIFTGRKTDFDGNDMLNVHPDSQQPIIPRHLRKRLLNQKRLNVAQTSADAMTTTQLAFDLGSNDSNHHRDTTNLNDGAQINHQIKQHTMPAHAAPIADVDVDVDVATPSAFAESAILNTANSQASHTTASEAVNHQAQSTAPLDFAGSDATALHPHTHAALATAQVAEFDGESNLLDEHLSEQQRRDAEADIANAEHVITLKIMANPRRALSGDKALKVLLKYGLRYGELSCFHRHEQPDQDSPLMFSVLRITDFGYGGFDLENLSTEQVQGFALFMTFPHANALTGFDMMSSIAHLVATEIDGRVFDETHREYTPQLKLHWRNHVIDLIAKNPQ